MARGRLDETWHANRSYLVDLAYRMLGQIGPAEDIVQEAFIRFARTQPDEVRDERGWLTVVTSRLCLDHLRSARSRHEVSRDIDAMERAAATHPRAADPADRVTLDDEVRNALAVVLQRLSPAERVALILHDVFQVPFDEIAHSLGKQPASCRQLARRARQKISADDVPVGLAADQQLRGVTQSFLTACSNGDLPLLVSLLRPDVWGTAELAVAAAAEPDETASRHHVQHGPAAVAATLLRFFGQHATLVSTSSRQGAQFLAFSRRRCYATITLTVDGGQIAKVEVVADPSRMASPGLADHEGRAPGVRHCGPGGTASLQ